jgi:hypothetical protein
MVDEFKALSLIDLQGPETSTSEMAIFHHLCGYLQDVQAR